LAEGWPPLERFGRAVEKLVEEKNGINIPVEISTAAEPKPPIGIMPEKLWKECRMWNLIECLARYHIVNSSPIGIVSTNDVLVNHDWTKNHELWLDELRRLLHEVLYRE
jgi:hypothetical protein